MGKLTKKLESFGRLLKHRIEEVVYRELFSSNQKREVFKVDDNLYLDYIVIHCWKDTFLRGEKRYTDHPVIKALLWSDEHEVDRLICKMSKVDGLFVIRPSGCFSMTLPEFVKKLHYNLREEEEGFLIPRRKRIYFKSLKYHEVTLERLLQGRERS